MALLAFQPNERGQGPRQSNLAGPALSRKLDEVTCRGLFPSKSFPDSNAAA